MKLFLLSDEYPVESLRDCPLRPERDPRQLVEAGRVQNDQLHLTQGTRAQQREDEDPVVLFGFIDRWSSGWGLPSRMYFFVSTWFGWGQETSGYGDQSRWGKIGPRNGGVSSFFSPLLL